MRQKECLNVMIFSSVVGFSPTLTWRDMQHLVVISSRTEPLRDAYWIVNGVGRKGDILSVFNFLPAAL